jgi:peptide/nickel transport system substrate-binding protein
MLNVLRRYVHILRIPLAITVICIGFAGCSAPPVTDQPDMPPGSTLVDKESPMLTTLVDRGLLPPLDKRLPADPYVVKPYESPGEYGGTWHMMVDTPDLSLYKLIGGYAPLMRWKSDCSGIEPGLATAWEYNKDGTQLTIHLRQGVKWSDGAPYTSADLAYWADISLNKQSQTVRPFWTLVHGKDMTYSCPDPYTFVMKFAGPDWYVPLHLATGFWESEAYQMPKHYLIQFDPNYNRAYKDYTQFDLKNETAFNPDRPSLCPWHLTSIADAGFRMTLERNPFYYMTDNEGRQLPYIDQVVCSYVPDPQVQVLKILSGQVDAQFRLMQARDIGLYMRGQPRGHYRVLRWLTDNGANTSFMLNWSAPDPILRQLIRDVRFRKALSLAIDRNKCNEVAWQGLAVPQQATISPDSWHFKVPGGMQVFEDWAHAGAGFDIPQGNRLLDSMGLTKRDADGYRLRPDGKRLSLLVDLPPAASEDVSVDETQIAEDGWRKLGIDVNLHNWPLAEFYLRTTIGEYVVSTQSEAEMDLFTYPDWVFPTTANYWHPMVGKWYQTGGKKGEAPTGIMKQLLAIYDQIEGEGNLAKSQQLVLKAIRLETQQGYFSLGTAGQDPALVMVKDNFRNVPPSNRILGPWAVVGPATSYPETFFFASRATLPETGRKATDD